MTFVTRIVQLKFARSTSFLTTRVEYQPMSVSRLSTSPPPITDPDIRPYASIPSPPKHPILGHFPLIQKTHSSMHNLHFELQKKYGDIVKLCIPGRNDIVFCYNPDYTKAVFEHDGKMPLLPMIDSIEYYRTVIRKDLFPHPGLLSQNETWLDYRSTVNPDIMRKKSMMFYLNDIESIANELIGVFEREKDEENRICLKTPGVLQRWALESVGFIFLGARLGTLKENLGEDSDGMMLIKHIETIFETWLKLALYPPIWKYVNVPYYKRYNEANEEIVKIAMKYIDAALKNNSGDHTILSKLAEKFNNDRALINVMAIDAINGGTHSTASSAVIFLYHLASNPDKQELLHQEILSTIGPTGHMTESAISKMHYLRNCLQESQRLLPLTIGVARVSKADMTLGGYHIPKGTFLTVVAQISSRDERFFHTPDVFLPERWNRSDRDEDYHPFASLPFGFGPKTCVGKRIAQAELYVLIAKILQKYRLEYEGGEIDMETGSTVSKPDRDVVIKLVNRN